MTTENLKYRPSAFLHPISAPASAGLSLAASATDILTHQPIPHLLGFEPIPRELFGVFGEMSGNWTLSLFTAVTGMAIGKSLIDKYPCLERYAPEILPLFTFLTVMSINLVAEGFTPGFSHPQLLQELHLVSEFSGDLLANPQWATDLLGAAMVTYLGIKTHQAHAPKA